MKVIPFLLLPLLFGVIVLLLPSSTSGFKCVECQFPAAKDMHLHYPPCDGYKEGDEKYITDCPPVDNTTEFNTGNIDYACLATPYSRTCTSTGVVIWECGSGKVEATISCYCKTDYCNKDYGGSWGPNDNNSKNKSKGNSSEGDGSPGGGDGSPDGGSLVGSSFGFILLLGISLILLQ